MTNVNDIDLTQYDINVLNQFHLDLEEFGIELTEYQLKQFVRYYELLVEWNQVMNLTTITDFDSVFKKHFLDSLSIVKTKLLDEQVLQEGPISLIDIGTGAGFPGVPIKILFPSIQVTLLDSLNKRIKFLDTIISELHLTDINTLHGRAEDFAKPNLLREKYTFCVSRAVSNLSTLAEYCIPYVKRGGYFISYKTEKATTELVDSRKAIHLLGGKVFEQIDFHLPNSNQQRTLVVIKKVETTHKIYPRKAGLPLKNPL